MDLVKYRLDQLQHSVLVLLLLDPLTVVSLEDNATHESLHVCTFAFVFDSDQIPDHLTHDILSTDNHLESEILDSTWIRDEACSWYTRRQT